jgi:hypothetical protein
LATSSDAALYLPFALIPGVGPVLVVLIVVACLIAELTGVLAPLVDAPRRYAGPFGKSDRAIGFGLLAVLLRRRASTRTVDEPLSVASAHFGCAHRAQSRARHLQRCEGAKRMSGPFGLPANVVYATAGIYALLVLATVVVWLLRWRNPG